MVEYLQFCESVKKQEYHSMKTSAEKKRPYVCGLEASLDLVNGKWKPLILRAIRKGARRYRELRRTVAGISDKMLIMHLKELEADRVVARKDFQEIPPRVESSLTPFGVSLIDTMIPMCEWGSEHMKAIPEIKGREYNEKAARA
jgi:DNA-binding HxlR family transcriptional regulator